MAATDNPSDVAALFAEHMQAELDGDLDRTMATMAAQPHLIHVPVRAGGYGYDEVRQFYGAHLVGRFFPPDVVFEPISRTVDHHQVVDEMVISFTHSEAVDWMLPGVAPTGRRVQIPLVAVVRAEDGAVVHEHIYWDQAAVLVQVGLLEPQGLPVTGADQAELVRDPTGEYRTDY